MSNGCRDNRPGDLYCNGRLDFDLAAMRKAGGSRAGEFAPAMEGGMMAARPAAMGAPPSAARRVVHLDAGAWRAGLPAPWRDASQIWRALAPLPPVAGIPAADLEAALRAVVLDPVYQVQ